MSAPLDRSASAGREPGYSPRRAKIVLTVGFGGVLALMAAAGVDSVSMLGRIEATNAQITHRFLNRNHLLERIRGGLYLSSTYIRDYLLDPDPGAAENHLVQFKRLQAGIDSDLAEYSRLLSPQEQSALSSLRQPLEMLRNSLEPVSSWSAVKRHRQGYFFLTQVVIPQRAQVLQAADQIAVLNENQVRESESRSAAVYAAYRGRMSVVLALALAFGSLLSWFSVSHLVRAEREARDRYNETLRTRDELKRLSARLQDAQEQERRSLSRELHDEIGQSLTALLVDLGNAVAEIPPERAALHSTLASARQLAERSVGAVRNLALLLRPSMLDDFGLVPALHWQAREVSRRTGLRVEVSADEVSDDLPDGHKTCIYRIVQEALHNCARHASAKMVKVVVRQETARILMVVQDDGNGFDVRLGRGLGLIGMEERVRRLDGDFEVQSEPGKGTLVRVELPLAQAGAAAPSEVA
jgi:signal transduction histidine kinase